MYLLNNSFRYALVDCSRERPLTDLSPYPHPLFFPFVLPSFTLYLQYKSKVYIVDKTENNPAQVAGHPAWAVSYDIETNNYRPQDVISNAFCAGGTVLGNGSYLNVGGNAAVQANGVGVAADSDENVYE